MTDHLVLGHALITMVEPEPATVVDYNRWYETDHFLSGVLTGPGAFAGRRFLATKALKSTRFPKDSPVAAPVELGSFLAVYWIEQGRLDAHCAWGFPEAARLAALGRMRSDRTHVSTSYYDLVGSDGRGARPVPLELALHHPYSGIVVVWSEGTGDRSAHERWAVGLRSALTVETSAVGQVATFRPVALPDPLPQMPGAIIGADPSRDLLVHLCFVDDRIRSRWRELSLALHAEFTGTADATARLVAPFIPSVTGSDTYLDELW